MKECPNCKADLTEHKTVTRIYINKDDGPAKEVIGHYDGEEFTADQSVNMQDGRYDLCDGSDICEECGEVLQ